jgi:hypothetical protein
MSTPPERAIEQAKKLWRETEEIVFVARRFGAEFLIQELDKGITFARLAHDSTAWSWKRGHRWCSAAAREAHETVIGWLPRTTPTPDQEKLIRKRLATLERLLTAFEPKVTEIEQS